MFNWLISFQNLREHCGNKTTSLKRLRNLKESHRCQATDWKTRIRHAIGWRHDNGPRDNHILAMLSAAEEIKNNTGRSRLRNRTRLKGSKVEWFSADELCDCR